MSRGKWQKETIPVYEEDQEKFPEFPMVKKMKKNETWMKNSPMVVNDYDPKDVSSVMKVNNLLRNWGRVSRPKTDDEVEQRIDEYLQYCELAGVRPTVEGMGLALGHARGVISKWRNGKECSMRRMEMINYAYDFMASFDADMVINNKMPPVPYIFRSKNYYGLRDQTELVVSPMDSSSAKSPEEIAEQYAFLDDVEEGETLKLEDPSKAEQLLPEHAESAETNVISET